MLEEKVIYSATNIKPYSGFGCWWNWIPISCSIAVKYSENIEKVSVKQLASSSAFAVCHCG